MQSSHSSAIGSDAPAAPGRDSRSWELTPRGNFWRATFLAMGSPCELLCETDDAMQAEMLACTVAAEAWRIEAKFSRYVSGNIVDRINSASGAEIEVDQETAGLLDFANMLYELSDRRFDISSGVLRRAWTFDGSERVPSDDDIRKTMRGQDTCFLRLFTGVDLNEQVRRSALRLNFGGDLAVTGPPRQQATWQVGLESLQGPSASPSGLIQLRSGALATSGDTRRFLFKNGIRYSHILDPTTGWPIANAPASVTVAADTCVQAGVLCTLAMLRGSEAETMLEAEGSQFWCAWP